MSIKYVAGLYFNEDKTSVALIRKNRPTWQAGKLNCIGGKIEINELPLDAMIREFREEAGVNHIDWRLFCILTGHGFEVNFFTASGDLEQLRGMTDEELEIIDTNSTFKHNFIPNLKWLIPMALDENKVFAVAKELP